MGEIKLIRAGKTIAGNVIDNKVPLNESEDAYKAIGSNISIINCQTYDTRCRISAHCDHIQLIPTNTYMRYFGATAENIKIIGGGLDSNGSMQAIFSSDGVYRNVVIEDQTIDTESEHKISLCGVLDNIRIKDIKTKDGGFVPVLLDNLRIGGGADGNFYVLSFKDHKYGDIDTDQFINDKRGQAWRAGKEYVSNFDLDLWVKIADELTYTSVKQHLIDCKAEYKKATDKIPTKIALIVGHNEKSQGAERKGVTEYSFWSELLPELISPQDVEIKIFTRKPSDNYAKEMRDVHAKVDTWWANISVECHFNGFSGRANGHEVLNYKSSKGGRIVADIFDKAMDKHLNNKDRGVKPVGRGENGNYGLRVGKSKSILIEPFFGNEITSFLQNGTQRENLVKTFNTFFSEIVNINNKSSQVTHKRNYQLTEKEYNVAMRLIN